MNSNWFEKYLRKNIFRKNNVDTEKLNYEKLQFLKYLYILLKACKRKNLPRQRVDKLECIYQLS